MRTLDRSRPYAEVYGLPGAAFEQDGFYFTPAGAEAQPEPIVQEPPIPSNDTDPNIGKVTVVESEEPKDDFSNLEAMRWAELKALVEAYGGECKSRKAAYEFLRGR